MLECVVNISEGRRSDVVDAVAGAAGDALLDVHSDPHHNRSVLTMVGLDAALAVALAAIETIDIREHHGVHPRLGSVDVVPFVPLDGSTIVDAIAARDDFAGRVGIPCFLYGPDTRTLPEIRKRAWRDLLPDVGGTEPHPTAGAVCVGARPVLVAYNVWLAPPATVEDAKRIATEIRRPGELRTLGLQVGDRAQVSCNLIEPSAFGPDAVFDAVAARAAVAGAELVGLVPDAVLRAIPPDRWSALDLSPARTIEARLAGGPHRGK